VIGAGIGRVVQTAGELLLVALPGARIGDGVRVRAASGASLRGEVTAIGSGRVAVAPFGSIAGVAAGDRVESSPDALCYVLGYGALGRAIDAGGAPIDGGGALRGNAVRVARNAATIERQPVTSALWTGIRAIDGLLTIGRGARVGLFGAPGAGKTTLLESIARGALADAVVVALVGERGREAARWLATGDARSTIVCATADRPAAERVRAADLAMAQAVSLRARGLDVLLILDSLARYAAGLRELRAGLGESVGRGGYPPAVFAELARYLECAGNSTRGTITLIATVLCDGPDDREPLADAARAGLDGHIVLSAELARCGRFPAIDVLASASRTMPDVASSEHRANADALRGALALLADSRDLRALGLADTGDTALARAVAAEPEIRAFLEQRSPAGPGEVLERLRALASRVAGP
jgi:ATP synthase in type III secretion protein N